MIIYLQVQVSTRNLIRNIAKLKEPRPEKHLKDIDFIFHPNLLYSSCHFLNVAADYFTNRINSMEDKLQNYVEHEFYNDNY